jgi:hypothetical protein
METKKPTVALCVIATGRYLHFWDGFLESALRFFLPGQARVVFCLLVDRPAHNLPASVLRNDRFCQTVPPLTFPWATLLRYHLLGTQQYGVLYSCDYTFLCDVDARFVAPVGMEILGDLVAVKHAGFTGKPREAFTYETRPESACCIGPHEGTTYYAGGFQGGKTHVFIKAMESMKQMIDADGCRGIIPRWHDESAWNRYLIDNPPTVALPGDWLTHEGQEMPNTRLISLAKDNRLYHAAHDL